jgi:hypothetical protein
LGKSGCEGVSKVVDGILKSGDVGYIDGPNVGCEEIGRVIRPEGTGLITTRGRDVMNTIGGRPGPEPDGLV